MPKISIIPLSANKMWQGRRFRTKAYDDYERTLMLLLPPLKIDQKVKLELDIRVGLSSKLADIDNICKPLIDILQKAYNFNDRNIYRLMAEKEIVKKGSEFIQFEIKKYEIRTIC